MVDICASVKAMIHHKMGIPYPIVGPTSATKVGETPNSTRLGQKNPYTIPQRRLGKEIVGESSKQRTQENGSSMIEDIGHNHINDQERARVGNNPTFDLDDFDEYASPIPEAVLNGNFIDYSWTDHLNQTMRVDREQIAEVIL